MPLALVTPDQIDAPFAIGLFVFHSTGVTVPKGVTVHVRDGAVEVQGPKGTLKQVFPSGIKFELAAPSAVDCV